MGQCCSHLWGAPSRGYQPTADQWEEERVPFLVMMGIILESMSAVDAGTKRNVFFPFDDAERNMERRKAMGFSSTVATLAGGTLSVPNNAQTAALTVTTTAAKDFASTNLSASTAAYTCPHAGLYHFVGEATFATGTTGLREVNIFNSTTSVALGIQSVNGAADIAVSNIYVVNVSCIAKCAAGDVIQLRLFQNSGGALLASAVKFCGVYLGQSGGIGGTSQV
jgi:hypothetical protein